VLLLALRMLNTSRPEPSEARQTRAAAAKAGETEAAIVRSHSRGEHLVGVFGVQSHSNLRQTGVLAADSTRQGSRVLLGAAWRGA